MIAYQEILEAISVLSEEDQEELFELIRKRRIENRRSQIATNAQKVLQAVDEGKVVKGSFADIKAYLLDDEDDNNKLTNYKPKTELGKKLWTLRQKSLGSQPLLNSWDEVEKELHRDLGNIS